MFLDGRGAELSLLTHGWWTELFHPRLFQTQFSFPPHFWGRANNQTLLLFTPSWTVGFLENLISDLKTNSLYSFTSPSACQRSWRSCPRLGRTYFCYQRQKPVGEKKGHNIFYICFWFFLLEKENWSVSKYKIHEPQLQYDYLGPTEHFVSDVLAGVHNSVTIQLQGNDRTFSSETWKSKSYIATVLATDLQTVRTAALLHGYIYATAKHRSSSIMQNHVTITHSLIITL